ncbi:hypothetical protein [Thauera butanivorans]|nr:hypothetical protein [Thauera butanivorans]
MCNENDSEDSGAEEVPEIIEAPSLVLVQESIDIPSVNAEKEE